jgi:hypothetical protein
MLAQEPLDAEDIGSGDKGKEGEHLREVTRIHRPAGLSGTP